MPDVINNTFWAVFYGSTLGTLTIYLLTSIIEEYKERRNSKGIQILMDEWDEILD